MNGWVERESNPTKNQSAISKKYGWAPGELPFQVPVGQLGLAEHPGKELDLRGKVEIDKDLPDHLDDIMLKIKAKKRADQ